MLFVLLVSLYTSRVVLNTLGVEDYGVYNVVSGFVAMFSFLNATLSSSMQRFYNFEGTKNGGQGWQKVYSNGLAIHIALGLVLLVLLESFGLWYVNRIMVIPAGREFAANIVYQASIISMILVVFQIPYTGALMADERMGFYALVSVIDVSLKLLSVMALPFLPYDKLVVYGMMFLGISLFDFLAYFIYAKRKVLRFRFVFSFDREMLKSLLSFSGWNLLGTFAFMLKGQGVNMILNSFFGTVINAARGVAYQVNSAITGFTGNLSVAFRPQIVNSYADSDTRRCTGLMFFESKVCYCLALMLITPVALEIDYLLDIWLGQGVPQYTNIFAILVLLDSLVCTLNAPVTQVVFATGEIRKYQIYSSIVNLLLLPACYVFLKLGYEASSVFVITIVVSVLNQIVCLWAMKKVYDYSVTDYLKQVILPCAVATVLVPLVPYIVRLGMDSSFLRFLAVGLATLLVLVPVVLFVVLNREERTVIMDKIRARHA